MLNDKLKELRKSRGYSQQQVASKLHITQGAVSQWEKGTTIPSLEQLAAVADIYQVTVDELLGRPYPEPPKDAAWEIRERLRRDPSYRMLFDAAKSATPDHLEAAAAMLKVLEPKRNQSGYYQDEGYADDD